MIRTLFLGWLMTIGFCANASIVWNIAKHSPSDHEIAPNAKLESIDIHEAVLVLTLTDSGGSTDLRLTEKEIEGSAGMNIKEMIELITDAETQANQELTFIAQRQTPNGELRILRLKIRFLKSE